MASIPTDDPKDADADLDLSGGTDSTGTGPAATDQSADQTPDVDTAESDDPTDDVPEAMAQAVRDALKAGNSASIFVIGQWTQHSEYTQGDAITHNISAARDAAVRVESDSAADTAAWSGSDSVTKFSGDVAQWWDKENPSPEDLCRLIAIAVLEGATYQVISSYASSLLERFNAANLTERPEPRTRPQTIGRVLSRLGAYRARQPGSQNERVGREVVFLEKEDWRAHCLIAAWREFEQLAASFPESIVELAATGTREARRSLQESIAILLVHDPDAAFQRVIKPLSKGTVPQRWVAANALAVAARTPSAESYVISTIEAAARMRHGKGVAIVAALCLANEFGRRRQDDTVSILLLLIEKWRSLDAALGIAIESVIRVALSNPSTAELVLNRLSNWFRWNELLEAQQVAPSPDQPKLGTNAPRTNAFAPGALSFMTKQNVKSQPRLKQNTEIVEAAKLIAIIASAILTPQDGSVPRGVTDSDLDAASRCPVAVFAGREPKVAVACACLLIRLLKFPPAQRVAWTSLQEVLRWSDEDKAAGAIAILRAFCDIANREDVLMLRDYLRRWQRDPEIRTTIERAF